MTTDEDEQAVSHTPPLPRRKRRKRRRRSSTASSDSDDDRRRKSSRMSTQDVIKMLAAYKNEPSKNFLISSSSMNNVVPEFNPTNRAQTVENWIKKVNECSVIYGWDEKQTIHFALQKLGGLAKKWYETLPSVVYTWEEWQHKLKRAFPCDENYGRLLEEMLARTSRSDESFREYFYDKFSLLNRCEIHGKKAVDCIVHGIGDRSVRSGAQAQNCREPEDLLTYLCSQRAVLQPQVQFTTKGKDRNIVRNSTSTTVGVPSNSSEFRASCYNCKMKGHPFYKCPKPLIRCVKCHRVGHNNDNCKLEPIKLSRETTQWGSVNSETTTLKIESNNSPNEKFFKSVNVNQVPMQAYVDFGSECSLIRNSEAERLNLNKAHDNLPVIKGFGNSAINPLYKSMVDVKIDEVDATIEVLVVHDAYLQTDLLIGQNFTELSSVTVLKDNKRLVFYKIPIDVDTEDHIRPLKLFASEACSVSQTSLIPVQLIGDVTFTGDVLVEGYIATEPGKEYSVPSGAYHITKGKGSVIVTNLSGQTLNIKADTVIARSIPFIETDIRLVNRIRVDVATLEPLNGDDIKVGQGLSSAEIDKLHALLQEYRDCFAENLGEIGCAVDLEMKINLLDDKPVIYRPYRLSFSEREKVREAIDELLSNDIIEESNSDYASPILMVKKKTGEQRLCVDFRALNNKTIKDRFPLPLIEDQVTNLSGNTFFTTLDLASGYYQVPMAPESRHLTGFVTPDGHYQFKRMPFGLANAPAVFQRMINKILGNRRFEYALAYLDDILIPSQSVKDMFIRLESILKLLREFGLTLKLSKCRFFDTSISYLGYEISSAGIQPGETKTMAVRDFPIPQNIHGVRQFLGLTGYFRKFVKGYGEIAHPLTNLLKKDVPWQWTGQEDRSFSELKERLISRPVLALYDPKLETEVHTDASAVGIGGILMQWQLDPRVLKPVAYFSRQTAPEEKHLHSYELETLAVVCSLRKFRVYLIGLYFKVLTDCAALLTTLTKRDLVPRIARWWLDITEYTFEIEYRPGVRMAHVDALSRNTVLPADLVNGNPSVTVYTLEKENWFLTLQLADPDVSRIIKILKPEINHEYKDIQKNYTVKNHALYRRVDDRLCLVVPRSARWQVCRANHDDMGHLGYSKTLERIQGTYWFTKLRPFVKKYVGACIECAYNKDTSSKQKAGYLYPIEKVQIPFHTIHIDHLGPFVKSRDGNCYILTIVDGFSKYVFVRAVRDTKTKNTVKTLQSIFYDFGVPARIVSDRGTSFTSTAFKSFCERHGIKHVLNAVACPRANGQAERFNQTILHSLAAQNSGGHERDWDKCLGKLQWGINNTVSSTTHKTATEALFGIKMRDDLMNKLSIDTTSHNVDLQQLRDNISSTIKQSQTKQKLTYDSKRVPAAVYKVGDLVKIVRNNYNNDGKSTKLLSKFVGPYKIVDILGNDRYRITDIPGFNRKGKPYETVISADRIRRWINIKALEVYNSDDSSSEQNEESE